MTDQQSQTVTLMAVEVAKYLRRDLRTAFPDVKFSVRTDGPWISVTWTDGPTDQEVRSVANQWSGDPFIPPVDAYHDEPRLRPLPAGTVVSPVVSGITYHRELSLDRLTEAAGLVRDVLGVDLTLNHRGHVTGDDPARRLTIDKLFRGRICPFGEATGEVLIRWVAGEVLNTPRGVPGE